MTWRATQPTMFVYCIVYMYVHVLCTFSQHFQPYHLSWSIGLVPGAPSSIEVSIWKYHSDPDINQWPPRGEEREQGHLKSSMRRIGPQSGPDSPYWRAFPPVAAGARQSETAASEFNTRCSCELEAQKDTVERRYVPRLIIRPAGRGERSTTLSFSLCFPQNFSIMSHAKMLIM